MRRSAVIRRIFLILFIAVLAGVTVLLIRRHGTRGLAWAYGGAGVAATLITIVAFVGPWFARWWGGGRGATSASVTQAAADLAATLKRQWEDVNTERRINDPWPLPVRWDVTPASVEAMRGVSLGQSGEGPSRLDTAALAGHYDDIIQTFRQIPSRRLVILGPAGGGKSVLVSKLAHDLLAHRQSGDRVPVILPTTTWDPRDDLSEWISAQLVRNYPSLSLRLKRGAQDGGTVADALASGGVLPVIDGLDELPEHLRGAALGQINKAGSNIPLVLTSRPGEYLRAVASAGRPVSRAAVVELLPLQASEARDYLKEATSQVPEGRWAEVFHSLETDPAAPLTAVFSTPLMLWLARTVYEDGATDPSILADNRRFADREAIENSLLDAFIPAIYPGRPGKVSKYRWSARQAHRWLSYLAALLHRRRSTDLGWWQLGALRSLGAVSAAVRGALMAAAIWGAIVWVLWRHGEWRDGSYVRHTSLHQIFLGGIAGPALWHAFSRFGKSAITFAERNMHTAAAVFSSHSLPLFALKFAIFVTVPVFILAVVDSKNSLLIPRAIRFSLSFKALARAVITSLIALGVLGIVVLALSLPPVLLLPFTAYIVIVQISALFVPPIDISRTTIPAQTFRRDRNAAVFEQTIDGFGTAVFVWLFCGLEVALAAGMLSAARLICQLFLGRMQSGRYSSSAFTDTRIWLACTRRMPWRTMTFLADARQRGALRQVGVVYQFRHVRLQERLAAQHASRLPGLMPLLISASDRWRGHTAWPKGRVWIPASVAPRYERVWARRFTESAAAFTAEFQVGPPRGEIYNAGPGMARRYSGTSGTWDWVLCALPKCRPVLVARSIWESLGAVTGAVSGDDACAATGMPVTDDDVAPPQRVILAGVQQVKLDGGSWGPGTLTLTGADEQHWAPDARLIGSASRSVPRFPLGWNHPLMRVKVTVTMPYSVPAPSVTRQLRGEISAKLSAGELTRTVAALSEHRGARLPPVSWEPFWTPWPFNQIGLQYVVTGPRGNRALAAAIKLVKVSETSADGPRLVAEVRVNIHTAWGDVLEAAGARVRDVARLRLSADELLGLLVAAWDTAADVMLAEAVSSPTGSTVVGMVVAVPEPAGPELVTTVAGFSPYLTEAGADMGSALTMSRAERAEHVRAALAEMAPHLGLSVTEDL